MNSETVTLIFMLAIVGTAFAGSNLATYWDAGQTDNLSKNGSLKKFDSPEEVKEFLNKNMAKRSRFEDVMLFASGAAASAPKMTAPSASTAPSFEGTVTDSAGDYSTTNVQVQGVDEADIVKNDGKYIYVLSGSTVTILDAYPPEDAEILSTINVKGNPSELYINGDRLIILGNDYIYTYVEEGVVEPGRPSESFMPYPQQRGYQKAVMYIYDIKDRSAPELAREVSVDGNYYDSRMIGSHIYVIASKDAYYSDDIEMPTITDSEEEESETPDIYYFDEEDSSYSFTTVISVDIQNDGEDVKGKVYLLGSAGNLFVSQDNIYITYQKMGHRMYSYNDGETSVHKIAIDDGNIFYVASGEVPGHVLNQFSMDEHDSYFRIATTTGHVSRSGARSSANHIYVLDGDLKIVGKLEDLAPGEKIYSARFMGKRAYLVTFKKVDPLFVIDLSDPKDPEVLGKLKIPGYSDYLHPYDENHIIGLGKDTVEAQGGDFAWYQGIKLALFDVTDVENPKEVSKFVIGDRGTDSYALRDHKAFLFSREKNILVIPVLLAKINDDRYYGETAKNAYGEYVWQGAYVFHIDAEDGLALKGTISHADGTDSYNRNRWFYQDSKYSIKRSLYMDDTLYTISDGMVKMNDLDYLYEINKVRLTS